MYRRCLLSTILLFSALGARGRVISYAPYTSSLATPAFQSRMNRHFALVETATVSFGLNFPSGNLTGAQLVVYDSAGVEEPRVVFPTDSSNVAIDVAATREDESGLTLLVQSDFDGGMNPGRKPSWFLSLDDGATWKKTALPDDAWASTTSGNSSDADIGGPFIRAAGTGARAATHDTPFIVSAVHGIYSVARDGSAKQLLGANDVLIIGDNTTHDHFLVGYKSGILSELDLAGNVSDLGPAPDLPRNGWIAGDGSAYAESGTSSSDHWLRRYANGVVTTIVPKPDTGLHSFVAVPTADYNGVWMAEGMTGNPTRLELYTPQNGIVTQWSDISGPQIEALLPGASGKTVLIQVHRLRVTTSFLDPALAVWHTGDPAPKGYDELFLSEQPTKGFVHVDPDAIENGTPFVFDSGVVFAGCPICSPPPPTIVAPPVAGGSDVIQEWGVVHASLAQKLVLPGISHTQGAFGSSWLSDVTFYNPLDVAQHVSVLYIPTGSGLQTASLNQRDVTLAPREIRLVPDALTSLFGFESGGGAFVITPDPGGAINVTSRTYTQAAQGTYGFGMNGIDADAAVGPRFGLTFSGAFFGANTRTNLTLTDVSGRGASASLQAAGSNGFVTSSPMDSATAPAGGQQQVNGIAPRVGMQPTDTGGLVVQPLTGELIASVFAIDNRTNDPTYFPPDIPSTVVRIIPAIGHIDGANNSKFRSDLFLINPSSSAATVFLQISPWDGSAAASLSLTLLPNEARHIRDVLMTAFGRTGIARLNYHSLGYGGDTANVHVTSRFYTLNDDGGTYGALMPPLNSFQSAAAGDTLEILGTSTDSGVRTNVGLVDLSGGGINQGQPRHATIAFYDKTGAKVDELTVAIPTSAGMQLNDIFRARNIAPSVGPVLIRVTSVDGLIGAYASVVDNGTNDSTYLPANLAAKQ
jgi:hypothetical protein